MKLSKLSIRNFRNFQAVDIPLIGNVVLLGENSVGKSNLLFAIRLIMDPTLPDSARQLKLTDFWDGCAPECDAPIEIHLEMTDFSGDDALSALLTDFRTAEDPMTARLSYTFRKKTDVIGAPRSNADCEFFVFGGGVETRAVPPRVRRRIATDMLDALRDAESQLGTWRSSPLRPLLEEAIAGVGREDLNEVAANLDLATKALETFPTVKALEDELRTGLLALAGQKHDIDARLRFAPADPLRLFRSISMFIDDGKRGIGEASLGSANVALLALKLAEFAWRRQKNERSYSLLCIEEPEAHLHPQLQRAVFKKLFRDPDASQALIVTSHSPTLAAIAPLRSIVILKSRGNATYAHSLAKLPVAQDEIDDIERYLNATRAELLFARAVIFVEGDAEEALLPVFAEAMGHRLDELGVAVCNVAGANFRPYVKLAASLALPYAVVTDWDPLDGAKPALGIGRVLDLHDDVASVAGSPVMTAEQRTRWASASHAQFAAAWAPLGYFLNAQTFEVAIAHTPALLTPLLDILGEQGFGSVRTGRIAAWGAGTIAVDPSQLLSMIADIGKGRLSSKLARKAHGLPPPAYVADAITFVVNRV